MIDKNINPKQTLQEKLNQETAKISWKSLQKFFAGGNAIYISTELDLVQVAIAISEDNGQQVETWMEAGLVDVVSDGQALSWYEDDLMVWAVVIRPWVLVQGISSASQEECE